jgi:hypothetical protein
VGRLRSLWVSRLSLPGAWLLLTLSYALARLLSQTANGCAVCQGAQRLWAFARGQERTKAKLLLLSSVASVRLSAKLVPTFCGYRVPRGQRDGSLRLYSRLSRPEPLLFLPSSFSVALTRLSGPRSRPTTFLFFSFLVMPGNRTRDLWIYSSATHLKIQFLPHWKHTTPLLHI